MKVLIREPIAEAGIDLLRERFEVDVETDGDLAATIGGYDAIIIRSATKLTADLIERADRLKVIGRAGVGVDNVDLAAASKRGIIVANAPQSTVVSAAEHTLGLLLALTRQIPQAHGALKEGRWERSSFAGLELADKTLGLIGFGRIGQQVARRARGFEMRVSRYRSVRRAASASASSGSSGRRASRARRRRRLRLPALDAHGRHARADRPRADRAA